MLHEEIETLMNQQEDNKAFRKGSFSRCTKKKVSGVQWSSVVSVQVTRDLKQNQSKLNDRSEDIENLRCDLIELIEMRSASRQYVREVITSDINILTNKIESLKDDVSYKESTVTVTVLYGIIFWGNSAYSCNIFKIQKRIIGIILNARNRDSCRQLFKNLKTLPLKSQYIFSLLLFVAKNRDLYESNSENHNINIRFSSDLHTATVNLTTFQKGPFYFGIKIFNHFPTSIKNTSHDISQFRSFLKSFLLINSFYSLEEHFAWNSNRDLGSV